MPWDYTEKWLNIKIIIIVHIRSKGCQLAFIIA